MGRYVAGHALENANTQIFAMADVVMIGILASFRPSRAAPKFERGTATLSSSAMGGGRRNSARFLIFSRHTPPHEDFPDRGSSPHVSPGCLPIGRSYGGLGFRWRLLRIPDNTVTSAWGNLSPKAESEGDLVLTLENEQENPGLRSTRTRRSAKHAMMQT